MNHADAGLQGVHGAAKARLFPIDINMPFVSARITNDFHPEQDVHQSGFTRPVFANQAQYTTFFQGEGYVFQHAVAEISLSYALHPEQRHFLSHERAHLVQVSAENIPVVRRRGRAPRTGLFRITRTPTPGAFPGRAGSTPRPAGSRKKYDPSFGRRYQAPERPEKEKVLSKPPAPPGAFHM